MPRTWKAGKIQRQVYRTMKCPRVACMSVLSRDYRIRRPMRHCHRAVCSGHAIVSGISLKSSSSLSSIVVGTQWQLMLVTHDELATMIKLSWCSCWQSCCSQSHSVQGIKAKKLWQVFFNFTRNNGLKVLQEFWNILAAKPDFVNFYLRCG